PPNPAEREGQAQRFLKTLEGLGFDRLADPRTGQNGVQVFHELVSARSAAEFQQLAAARQLVPDQGVWPPGAPPTQGGAPDQLQQLVDPRAAKRELGESPADGRRPPADKVPLERVGLGADAAFRAKPLLVEGQRAMIAPVDPRLARDTEGPQGAEGRRKGRLT